MISRTINWLSRVLDLTAQETLIPRSIESMNPTLVIPLEYFWAAVGQTTRITTTVDHSAAAVETVIVPRSTNDQDTILLDWVWNQNAASNNYDVDMRLRDQEGGAVTTIFHVVIVSTQAGFVTRGIFQVTRAPFIFPNEMTIPRHVRANEELSILAGDGGVLATGNAITARTVSFPKDGPIPRLPY